MMWVTCFKTTASARAGFLHTVYPQGMVKMRSLKQAIKSKLS